MAQTSSRIACAVLVAAIIFANAPAIPAQTTTTAPNRPADANTSPDRPKQTSGVSDAAARSVHRAARRRARARAVAQAAQNTSTTGSTTIVGPSSAQRNRDAQILVEQKAQSAHIAQENDQTIANAARERQQQQAEPRIQDAPGPGSQPLAGEPAVAPAQPSEAPRIQDAPGPAQTLPQPPPASATPAPAPPQ